MTVGGPRELLQVPPGATDTEITAAFRRQAAVHHPDRGGDPDRFAALVAARDELLNARGEGLGGEDEGLLWDAATRQPATKADQPAISPLWFLTSDRRPGGPP